MRSSRQQAIAGRVTQLPEFSGAGTPNCAAKVILALGKIAWDTYLGIVKDQGAIASRSGYRFAHGAEAKLPNGIFLAGVYHPSQQNTQTGKLTPPMYAKVFKRIQAFLKRAAKRDR